VYRGSDSPEGVLLWNAHEGVSGAVVPRMGDLNLIKIVVAWLIVACENEKESDVAGCMVGWIPSLLEDKNRCCARRRRMWYG
jgi:hypothetical protein